MALPRPAKAPVQKADVPARSERDGWADAPSDRLPQRFDPTGAHRLEPDMAEEPARPARTRHVVLGVMLIGALGFAAGWLVSFYGLLPGVFLASDIGVPVLLFATLRGVAKIVERHLPHGAHAKAAAGLARAGSVSVLLYLLGTLTNVLQLAVGLALGVLAYQGYVTHTRLSKAGFRGLGPAFVPVALTVGAYVVYQVVRIPLGPVPGFDAMSAAAVFVAAIAILRATRSKVEAAARVTPRHDATSAAGARAAERRVLIAVIVGYVLFRIFISDVIPYGPIVEWFLVCIGVLFFAIVAADRIGTVPTRRSLPAPDKRTHVQRVSSLIDRQLADTESRLARFIERAEEVDWMHDHFARLLEDAGHSETEVTALVAPLARAHERRGRSHAPAEAMGVEARRRLVQELVARLRGRRVPTGTLKADPRVRTTPRRSGGAGAPVSFS